MSVRLQGNRENELLGPFRSSGREDAVCVRPLSCETSGSGKDSMQCPYNLLDARREELCNTKTRNIKSQRDSGGARLMLSQRARPGARVIPAFRSAFLGLHKGDRVIKRASAPAKTAT